MWAATIGPSSGGAGGRPIAGDRPAVRYIPAVPEGRTRLWAWSALGLAGSLLVAAAAPRALDDGVVGWWYHPSFPGSRTAGVHVVWIGMAILSVAWLGLWRRPPGRRAAIAIAAAWLLPLALAPPLFSRDVYSYLAQGTILHLGLQPVPRGPGGAVPPRPPTRARRGVAVLAPHDRPLRPPVPGARQPDRRDHRPAPDRRRAALQAARSDRVWGSWRCTCRGSPGRSAPTAARRCGSPSRVRW